MADCLFENLKNGDGKQRQIHAVYLLHHAIDNTVSESRFVSITGDPIRVRDYSNSNHFVNDVGVNDAGEPLGFFNAGAGAFGSDWYGAGECPSWLNTFKNNRTVSLYGVDGGPDWELKQGTAIPTGCADEKADRRWKRVCTASSPCRCTAASPCN